MLTRDTLLSMRWFKHGAPDTIRACDLCLRRANANQPCCPPPKEIEGLASIWMSHDGFHEKVGGEIPFSGRSSSVWFWSRKVENARSFNGS